MFLESRRAKRLRSPATVSQLVYKSPFVSAGYCFFFYLCGLYFLRINALGDDSLSS